MDSGKWIPVHKNGVKNKEIWAVFDENEKKTNYRCVACMKILKASSSPHGVKKHLEVCRNGVFYQTDNKFAYAASARRGDFRLGDGKTDSTAIMTTSIKTEPEMTINLQSEAILTSHNLLTFRIARLAAQTGLTYQQIISTDVADSLTVSCGANMPRSRKEVAARVRDFAESCRISLKRKLVNDEGFTEAACILNEWVSIEKKRYLNVQIKYHDKLEEKTVTDSLGLVCVASRSDSCKLAPEDGSQAILDKLREFHVRPVVLCLDDSSWNKKIVEILKVPAQYCILRSIQTAVLFYIKGNTVEETTLMECISKSNEEFYYDAYDSEENDIILSVGDQLLTQSDLDMDHVNVGNERLQRAVQLIRTLHKWYRSSEVHLEAVGHVPLPLDTPGKWSNLWKMVDNHIKHLSKLKNGIQLLIDSGHLKESQAPELPTDKELDTIKKLHMALDTCHQLVLSVMSQDATILSVDWSCAWACRRLNGTDFGEILKEKICERRNIKGTSIMMYLQQCSLYERLLEDGAYGLPLLNKTELSTAITSLGKELDVDISSLDMHDDSANVEELLSDPLALLSTLEYCVPLTKKRRIQMDVAVEREMKAFECGLGMGLVLKQCLEHLLLHAPSSIDAERAFSTASCSIGKLRSSVCDKNLEDLTFLNSYFKRHHSLDGSIAY